MSDNVPASCRYLQNDCSQILKHDTVTQITRCDILIGIGSHKIGLFIKFLFDFFAQRDFLDWFQFIICSLL